MFIDSDALIGSSVRIEGLLAAAAAAEQAAEHSPAFLCSHDAHSALHGGWILWPAASRSVQNRNPPTPWDKDADRVAEDDLTRAFTCEIHAMISQPSMDQPFGLLPSTNHRLRATVDPQRRGRGWIGLRCAGARPCASLRPETSSSV